MTANIIINPPIADSIGFLKYQPIALIKAPISPIITPITPYSKFL
jgi:hypothetical protein